MQSDADILFYGGQAGGGKTDLLIGASLTEHKRSIIYRREGTQLQGIYQRITEIVGNRDGFSQLAKTWNFDKRLIEFGSCPHLGDEQAYQGRPHDLIGFDEITHFLELQFRFLLGWLRSTVSGQRCRVIATGNPPTDSDGDWVIDYWGPWLNPDHPDPAQPGELRWYATIDGRDEPRPDGEPFEHQGEIIQPMSRTFIPSSVDDNPYHSNAYKAVLQGLPEPLRSQMLKGDFTAGRGDNEWQVIPTQWVKDAQARWKPRDKKGKMERMGVDVARGGNDETVLSPLHVGNWFDELSCYPGSSTPDGPMVAGLVIQHHRSGCPVNVDVIGVGASVYDHLKPLVPCAGLNGAEKSTQKMEDAKNVGFINLRAQMWWRFREALDPKRDLGIALPPGNDLRQDLCAPRWKLTPRGVQVESKEDLMKRIGRSPDKGDAVIYAWHKSAAQARKKKRTPQPDIKVF